MAPSQEHHHAPWWCQRLSSIFSTLGVQQVGRMPVGRTFQQGLQSIFPLNRKQGPPVPQQYSGPCPVPIDAMQTGSLSKGSKVMNADFYRDIRAQTAVCPVNAAMLSIKTKCRRYQTQQTSACALENKFSPCGEKEYSEVFGGIIQIYCLWYVTLYHSLQYIVSFANKLSNLMNKLHLQKK